MFFAFREDIHRRVPNCWKDTIIRANSEIVFQRGSGKRGKLARQTPRPDRNWVKELAIGGGYADLTFEDSEDPYCETGHNALFEGPDGEVWSSCHYLIYEKRASPFSPELQAWERTPQLGIEPVYYNDGMFSIRGPTWTEQTVRY